MVDPRYPMGMAEFEQLYTGAGRTPAESASMLHMTAPTEAKSWLREQWGNLGMSGFPEDYFSNPANRRMVAPPPTGVSVAPTASPVAGPQLYSIGPDGRPVFANEMMRNVAIDTGAYDPNYISPAWKAAAAAAEQKRELDSRMASAAQRYANPLTSDLEGPKLLQAQLAGDRGDTKRVLQSLQNVNADEDILKPPGERATLTGYRPATGIGGSPSDEPMASRLAMDIVNDPEFARLQQRDPARAAFVYKSLTGRDYAMDIKSFNTVQDRQNKFGMDFTAQAIRNGAKFDPVTGKWSLWQRTEPEGGGIASIGGAQGAQTRLVEGTPEQQMLLNRNYRAVTGYDLPQQNPMAAQMRQRFTADLDYIDDKQRGAYDDMVARATQAKGSALNEQEQRAILNKVLVEMPKGTNSIWWKGLEALNKMGENIGGSALRRGLGLDRDPDPASGGTAGPALFWQLFGPGGTFAK